MVLADLGKKIASAFRTLNSTTVIDEAAIDACLKEIASALLHADVNVRQVAAMRASVKNTLKLDEEMNTCTNKRRFIQKCVYDELVKMVSPDKQPYKPVKKKANVIMFVGLQGSGKTTTCTKYAHYYQRKGWKVALVCADTFRAGAFDQLKQNATKTRVPFYGSYTETDPVQIAQDGVELFRKEKYEIIIVDTSGRHRQEAALFDEMMQIHEVVQPNDVIFVMDSHIGQACFDQAKAFNDAVPVGSVIVTKLDGHAKGGGALSAVSATKAPIIFIGTGEHFDEFEPFVASSFVSRLMGLGDLQGLVDSIKEAMPLEEQKQLMKRMEHGDFTLRDLYEQLQNVMKLGPLNKVMSMIPGMNQVNMPPGFEQQGGERLKRFMTIMDSMTDEELDSKKPMNDERRIMRVARGAGTHPYGVAELLEEQKRFQKLIGNMGKAGLMSKGGELTNMMRNPKQVMQKIQQSMDPKMIQQMGGAQNVFNMMREIEKSDAEEQGMGLKPTRKKK